MRLAPFQCRTVEVALKALDAGGPRRFLVADEVGLGKTIIARSVAEALRKNRKRLNVLYLCPSLEIVGQNRLKFVSLTGIAQKDYVAGEDRLALVPGNPPQEGAGFRIFTFTPETSLPGWKPGPRTGRKSERRLIHAVLDRYEALKAVVLELDRQRSGPTSRRLFDGVSDRLEGYTHIGIERALREVFDCPSGNLERAIIAWLGRKEADIAEFVGRFRSALALAALRAKAVRPDLVILDEFHRYADLILPRSGMANDVLKLERSRVHRLLVEALLGGETPPAVLLLSATPYRLRRLNGEEVHPVEHYRALVDLAGFLANSDDVRAQVEMAIRRYHDVLTAQGDPVAVRDQVLEAKRGLEALLGPYVARTERALVHETDLFERPQTRVAIEAADLMVFRHLAQNAGPKFAGWAPAIWSSIPYPAQTMHGYKIWETLKKAPAPPLEAGSGRGRPAHPQLRLLQEMMNDEGELGLPWQPPTVAWWRLEGPWATGKAAAGKALLFSHWRGAPTAISALLSIQLAGGMRSPGEKAPAPLLRPGGSEGGSLVALFMPWPTLAHAIEPLKDGARTLAAVRRDAEQQLEAFLRGQGVGLDGAEKRPAWIVACGLEKQLARVAFNRVAAIAAKASRGSGAKNNGKAKDWKTFDAITSISREELAALAAYLLSAPGSILARCARRHGVPQAEPGQIQRLFDFSWGRLRGYLGHRAFADLIRAAAPRKTAKARRRGKAGEARESGGREPNYPAALCEAMLKGGFEAVLDEQMGVLGELGDARGLAIVEELANCLIERPGLVQFRRGKILKHRIPVQAVAPFAGGEQRKAAGGKGKSKGKGKLRSDTLRRAFNSPFWPHLLCTTSVGQEGLDFHQWCRRVVHWDLPGDPVDFEQREGRIARYGSLAVRQSLARAHQEEALSAAGGASPFLTLLKVAADQPQGRTGLERWWLPADDSKPVSISFDWSFSLRSERAARMLDDLLRYRLALGQPDPDAFVAMLEHIGADTKQARSLAIDLAAISR